MMRWIHIHGSAIETVVAVTGSPYTEAALSSLLSYYATNNTPARVQTLRLYMSNSSVDLLPQFSSITRLSLSPEGYPDVDNAMSVTALQGLPSLDNLELYQGAFESLDCLQHLTCLIVRTGEVACQADCAFATSLVELYMHDSYMTQFHRDGITACTSLQNLYFSNAALGGAELGHNMAFRSNRYPDSVPNSLTSLRGLTQLSLSYVHRTQYVGLGWLSQLASLQSLSLDFDVPLLYFPEGVSNLNQLTRIYVENCAESGQTNFSFDWIGLLMLQHVTISVYGSVGFCDRVHGLARLQHLRFFHFQDLKCVHMDTVAQLQSLQDLLTATRPDVLCRLVRTKSDSCEVEMDP